MDENEVVVAAEEERAMMTIPKPTICHSPILPGSKKKKQKQKTEKRKRSKTRPPINQEEESVVEAAATGEQEEEEQSMPMLPKLPQEMVIDILSRLPVKTLLRFRCVSKGWRSLISDPHFITQHLNRSIENCPSLILGGLEFKQLYTIKYETSCEVLTYDFSKFSHGFSWLEIVGSSNGLVCLCFSSPSFREKENILYLCNPATLEIKHLPHAPIEYTRTWDHSYTAFGFGFDSTGNDYKVLAIDYFCDQMNGTIHPSEVKVYSLNTGQWRRVEDVSFNINIGQKTKLTNAVVNGAIHWMGNYGNWSEDSQFIISFDLGLETFRKIPEHEYQHEDELYSKRVGVLDGCLSVFDAYTRERIEIWVMKDYGVKDSWTKLFTIDAPPSYEFDFLNFMEPDPFHSIMPIVKRWNGEVLLEKDHELVSYDPKSGREREIGPGGLPLYFRSVTYVESLVSLKVGQEGVLKHKGADDE